MLHTVLAATSSSHSVNWILIIGLSILIALPFISSSIIIPILLAIHKHENKKKEANKTKTSYKKIVKKKNTK